MRRSMKQDFNDSMEQLRFSRETKEDMVQRLMQNQKEQTMYHNSERKITFIALAAALILATLTGAAAFTRWSVTAQNRYAPSQDIKEQAEKTGLSVMLEETGNPENTNEVLSVTDQGITITAVQTIVDNYRAQITFRIDGFVLPEDEAPFVWPIVTIDGNQHFYGMQGGSFFDGTTRNEEGNLVYASTGEPVRSGDDEFQSLILDYVADDGSLEYTHNISFQETDGRYMGKEIVFSFRSIDLQSHQKAGTSVPQIKGNWELRWTLTGSDSNIKFSPNTKIGDSDVILLDAEIGQLSIKTRYQLKDYWDGWDELVELPQAIQGVRMKDGREYTCVSSTTGFENQEKMIYFIESTMFDAILDISQVDALMFHKGWEANENGQLTEQTFYYIPVS